MTATSEYKRTHVIGTTFSNALDDWVLRGEIAWFSNRHFVTGSPLDQNGLISSPELLYVLGMDWSAPYDIFASVQYFQSWIIDAHRNVNSDPLEHTLTLFLNREFFNDTLSAELLILGNINDGDGMIRPKIQYDYNDNLQLWLGADLFYGDGNGLFGQFKRNDRVVLGAEFAF